MGGRMSIASHTPSRREFSGWIWSAAVAAALALTLAALSVLNFIPVLGWIINFALMLFGLGALTQPIFARVGAPLAKAATSEQTD